MHFDLFGDEIGKVEYVSHMGSDLDVVNAARVSFGAKRDILSEKDIKLIKYLMKHKHTSPFEHCVVTMRFVVPLFIRSQHHRHRTWSYNEISRRYTSVDMKFYEPKEFRKQHDSNRQASTDSLVNPDLNDTPNRIIPTPSWLASDAVKQHNTRSLDLYKDLVSRGVCREQARGVLPQNLYTEYYGTVNLHNLLKFISLRSHAGAQWEIQKVADACLSICKKLYPFSVEAYESERRKQPGV